MDIPTTTTIQMIGHDYLIGPTAGQHDLPILPSMTIHPSSLWWFIYHSTGPATAVPMDVHPRPFLSLVTRSPFCSDTARFGLGFFARHLSMAMPAMQLCYGSMDATIETRLGAHSTTP